VLWAANTLVVLVSLGVGVLLCEFGARLVLNPADYLSVTMRPDPVVSRAVPPNAPGFDGWGFRNPAVPAQVEVVTVGDSHTFGNTASMQDAWPSVLQRQAGIGVYNLGLGGYGPNQYYHLMRTRGLSLHPRRVLCGLYMGDDFENAFSITYGLEHWAYLRSGERFQNVDADIWGDVEAPGAFKRLRNWLSANSMIYRIVVHGPVLGALKKNLQLKMATGRTDPEVTTLEIPEKNIAEAFRPVYIASRLDQRRPEIREGMRITFHLLKEMDRLCRDNGCSFAVVIIPTKETVFAEYLQQKPDLHLKPAVDAVIANERAARRELGEFLDREGITYVDALPALRAAAGQQLYYRGPADMHPAANGYRVIAGVAEQLLRDARAAGSRAGMQ
jgi:hypothetical protein